MKKMKKKGGGVLLRISNSRSGTFQAWTERSPYSGEGTQYPLAPAIDTLVQILIL